VEEFLVDLLRDAEVDESTPRGTAPNPGDSMRTGSRAWKVSISVETFLDGAWKETMPSAPEPDLVSIDQLDDGASATELTAQKVRKLSLDVETFLAGVWRESGAEPIASQPDDGHQWSGEQNAGFAPVPTSHPGSDVLAPSASRACIDVAQHLQSRAQLFRATFTAVTSPMRRWSATVSPSATERTLRSTREGCQLVQAMRDVVPGFWAFEHADFHLDRLMGWVYRSMDCEKRVALLRRTLEVAADDVGLVVPALTDSELVGLAMDAGISVYG
jgi:hypothetical protein